MKLSPQEVNQGISKNDPNKKNKNHLGFLSRPYNYEFNDSINTHNNHINLKFSFNVQLMRLEYFVKFICLLL